MMSRVFAHGDEATGSGMMNTNMMGETGEATFNHFMGDMMSFHWGTWSPVFIILWWVTWILVIITLVLLIRWFWIKGGKK
jgi:hypothetical protein